MIEEFPGFFCLGLTTRSCKIIQLEGSRPSETPAGSYNREPSSGCRVFRITELFTGLPPPELGVLSGYGMGQSARLARLPRRGRRCCGRSGE